jgi:6,7-dimethyl-8-ribityllumazine synthase
LKIVAVEPERTPEELVIGVAVSSFNQVITDRLLQGALTALEQLGVAEARILRVAGAWELPLAAKNLIGRGCDGVVAIGAIIKGETDHYDVIVRESAAGLIRVAHEAGIPVTNAVITAHNVDQAHERSEPGPGNKGAEAARAAVAAAGVIQGRSGR